MNGYQVTCEALAAHNGRLGKLGLLAAISVVSYTYSGIVLRLLDTLGWSLVASPQIAVAVVAVCLLPQARARWSPASAFQDGNKAAAASGCQEETPSTQSSLSGSSQLQSFRLAQPPFAADLSCVTTPSYSHTSASSRRRRFPRVSIELTPLPRVSLDFQGGRRSLKRSSSSNSSGSLPDTWSGSCSGSTLQDSSSSASLRWQPSNSRISSVQGILASHQIDSYNGLSTVDNCETVASGSNSCTDVLLAAGEATESLGHSVLSAESERVGEVVTDIHLLQIGALLGETSCKAALVAQEAGGPLNHPDSFYGSADTDASLQPWELIVSESNCSVLYWAWRRPLRKGLYMYMTRSVYLNATPAELRAFLNDDVYRVVWENSMQILRPLASTASSESSGVSARGSNEAVEAMAAAVAARTSNNGSPGHTTKLSLQLPYDQAAPACPVSSHCSGGQICSNTCSNSETLPHENGILQALVQFPKPMASRSYIYARRVWHRPSDGGCYCLSKSIKYQNPPTLPGRAVAVDDYASGCVVRSPAEQILPAGYTGAAAEVSLVYFEDSHVRPGLANMGVKKGLWPLIQRTEKALRVYQAGAAANIHLQSFGATTQRLQRSMSVPSPGSLSQQRSLVSFDLGTRSSCSGVSPSGTEAACANTPLQQSSSVSKAPDSGSDAPTAAQVSAADAGPTEQQVGSSADCAAAAKLISTTSKDSKQPGSHADSSSNKPSQRKKGPSWQAWLSDVTTAVGEALKGSAQILATASAAIWRSHTRVALLVPNLEWSLLQWCLQRVTGPTQLLLLPAPAAASASSNREALQRVNSHPIGDWAHPGLLRKLLQDNSSSCGPSLLRVASHPLSVEDLNDIDVDDGAACEVQARVGSCTSHRLLGVEEKLMDAEMPSAPYGGTQGGRRSRLAPPVAAAAAIGGSVCGSISGASSSSGRVVSSHPTSAAPYIYASGGSRCCDQCGNSSTAGTSSRLSSSGHGSVRVSGGGRRQRRLVMRLMQAAGVRVAHKLVSALGQPAAAATRD